MSNPCFRQHAIRQLLYTALFDKPVASLAKTIQDLQGKIVPLSPIRTKRHLIPPTSLKKRRGQLVDQKTNNALSDHTPQDQVVDLSKETLSEPEMSSNVRSSTPFPNHEHEDERLNRYYSFRKRIWHPWPIYSIKRPKIYNVHCPLEKDCAQRQL